VRAIFFAGLLCACPASAPRQSLGPLSIAVPAEFEAVDKYLPTPDGGPGASQTSRLWREPKSKTMVSLSVAHLPKQPEWSALAPREVLEELVNQALTAGERAGLSTVRSDRSEENGVLHYDIDGLIGPEGKKLWTFSRAAMWFDAGGNLVNATAVCTTSDREDPKCRNVLATVKLQR
jgi:hypothetical protein